MFSLQNFVLLIRISEIYIFNLCRDRCNNCRCFRYAHDIRFKDYISANERLQLDQKTMQRLQFEKPKKLASLEKGFTWQPSGLSSQEVNSSSVLVDLIRLLIDTQIYFFSFFYRSKCSLKIIQVTKSLN